MKKLFVLAFLMMFSAAAHADLGDEMASIFKVDENNNYNSTLDMRSQRKFGIGTAVGGNLGLFGVNFELNFEDDDGVVAGFGTGPGYNSFQLLWKHAFEGDYIAPYTTLGYSRWYNSSANPDDIDRSGVLNRALSESDKRAGQFATNFLTGSLGLQYNQLSGLAAGVSFFGELTLLEEVSRSVFIPTGSVGAIYYF